ncbi:unnamed protein product [Moneuplotes crassus]|uniref:Uncharacterized protein n=1 Tax=Euplotes crassus TaxID=5936 RepID=A0AAD1UPX5_EUPCR|nr:unnamed protein product [Moneuplotes crassus]
MEPEIPAKDAYNFVYFTFLALGMAILLPWSSLVTALDYFIVKLPGHDVDFVVSILSNGPFFATNVLMIIFGKWFGVKRVVGICMMLMMVLTLALPLIPQVAGSEGAWIWVVSIIITISAVNGVMQCCAYGLAGSLADHNIATLNTGIGLSGLTVSIARVISLVFFPTDGTSENDNFFYGAIMYFAIGGVFLIIGVILLVILPKTRYYQYHIDEEEGKWSCLTL